MIYCKAPFVSQKVGLIGGVCCNFPFDLEPTEEKIKQMRLDFLNGNENKYPACVSCRLKNKFEKPEYDLAFLDSLESLGADGSILDFQPSNVDVFISNICNCACVSCGDILSTSHETNTKRKCYSNEQYEKAFEDFKSAISNNKRLKTINMSYGEITLFPQFDEICDLLEEHCEHLDEICIISNGTNLAKLKKVRNLKLDNLKLQISIDAVKRNKGLYIRTTDTENILDMVDFNFEVSMVITILNCWDVEEIFERLDSMPNCIRVNVDIVSDPNWISISHMDLSEKIKLIDYYVSLKDGRLEKAIGILRKNLQVLPIDPTPFIEATDKVSIVDHNVLNQKTVDYLKRRKDENI